MHSCATLGVKSYTLHISGGSSSATVKKSSQSFWAVEGIEDPQYTVYNLQQGTLYTFQVFAINLDDVPGIMSSEVKTFTGKSSQSAPTVLLATILRILTAK